MHHAVLVHVVERVADAQGDAHRPLDGQPALAVRTLFVENSPQQRAFHPLDHHVGAAALFAIVGLHHAGVVEFLADFLLALEALDEHGVGLHLRVRHLDGHLPAVAQVGSPEQCRHAAARNCSVQTIVVQHVSGFECGHERIPHNTLILS